jgi:cobalt-zinc-cadmium resistance protein CzcA
MSLGALDFGLIVDGAVIIVENCIRRLAGAAPSGSAALARASASRPCSPQPAKCSRPPGQRARRGVVNLPHLALTGVEGKMFTPMAFTVIIALLAALMLSVTFVPAAIALFVGGRIRKRRTAMQWARQGLFYQRWRWRCGSRRRGTAAVVARARALLATRMGAEFIPNLDEGDIALHALRIPGTSLTQAIEMQIPLERAHRRPCPRWKDLLFKRRHGRSRHRSHAAQSVADNLRHAEGEGGMARPEKTKDDLVKSDAGQTGGYPGQRLRVHPADPDALQRADLGRALDVGGQGVRRRPGAVAQDRGGDRRGAGKASRARRT